MQYRIAPVNPAPKNQVIQHLIHELHHSSSTPNHLAIALNDTVQGSGWWDAALAENLLTALMDLLQNAPSYGSTLQRAFDRACEEARRMAEIAEEFAAAHPILVGVVCVVVALGVLYLLWPTMLSALGFGAAGPVEGSWAALWQSTMYGARVPFGSLFSYLQRLGMIAL